MGTIQIDLQQYLVPINKIYLLCQDCKATDIMNNLNYWSLNEEFKEINYIKINITFLHALT